MTKSRIAVTVVLYAFGLAALGGAIAYDNSSTVSSTTSSTSPAAAASSSPR